MRGRGLKLELAYNELYAANVAPHAGAWIETAEYKNAVDVLTSPPMRGRGLKLESLGPDDLDIPGRPPCGGVD